MQTRLESYINKLRERKKICEKILNPPPKKNPDLAFFQQEPKVISLKKLTELEALLKHLEEYKATTLDKINDHPENTDFYNSHLEAVVNLLENIEKKYPTPKNLLPEDFELIVHTEVEYKKTFSDSLNNIAMFAYIGGGITGVIGGIAAAVVVGYYIMPYAMSALAAALSSGTLITPEALGGAFAIILVPMFAIFAISFVAGFIVGAIPGALIGLVIGAIADFFITKPLENPYLDGKAFDCALLKKAYAEMVTVGGKGADLSANDEGMEEEQTRRI